MNIRKKEHGVQRVLLGDVVYRDTKYSTHDNYSICPRRKQLKTLIYQGK